MRQGGALDLLVRVQAPDQPADAKATITPKRLALVVDRSGSMDGQPLTEALRYVTHIADSMTAADSLSAVVYDDKVNVLVPLAAVTNRRLASICFRQAYRTCSWSWVL